MKKTLFKLHSVENDKEQVSVTIQMTIHKQVWLRWLRWGMTLLISILLMLNVPEIVMPLQ